MFFIVLVLNVKNYFIKVWFACFDPTIYISLLRNSVVIAEGRGRWERVRGIKGDGGRLDLGGEPTAQRTDDVL